MTTFIRCHANCGTFFEKKTRRCPTCGTEIRGVNQGMLSQRFINVMNEHKRHAIEET